MYRDYREIPKFSDARKLCCNVPKIQTKSQNVRVFRHKDANGIANSEDPDQTAPLGALSMWPAWLAQLIVCLGLRSGLHRFITGSGPFFH